MTQPERRRVGSLRHRARVTALQALYEADSAHHNPEAVLSRLLGETSLTGTNADFARELVYGVVDNSEKLDAYIQRFAPAWPVSQLSIIDRSILRLAIFEILLDNRVPVRVAINEAVELAKAFGSGSSAKFINGVLGAVSQIADTKEQRG